MAVGSAAAFLAAQLLDVAVFDRLRAGRWWRAPLVSTLAASALDTALFFTIAFSAALAPLAPGVDVAWANEALPLLGVGPVAPLWVSLAVADLGVKLADRGARARPVPLGDAARRRLRRLREFRLLFGGTVAR